MPTEVVSPETFAQSLGSKQLHCRELGHNWRPWTVAFDRVSRSYDRTLRCSNCHTTRVQVLDARGHVVSNRYVYPDNYLTKGRVERGTLNRDVFRVESIVRWLNAHDQKAG